MVTATAWGHFVFDFWVTQKWVCLVRMYLCGNIPRMTAEEVIFIFIQLRFNEWSKSAERSKHNLMRFRPTQIVLSAFALTSSRLNCSFAKTGAHSSSVKNMSSAPLVSIAGPYAEAKKPIYCEDSVMSPRAHGTCEKPVMQKLRWNCDRDTADRICCFNRHYAEHSGYWQGTSFLSDVSSFWCAVVVVRLRNMLTFTL